MLIIFDEVSLDEHPYLNWIRANPQGFVANVGRNLEDVFLHQATCSHITSPNVAKKGFIGPSTTKYALPPQKVMCWSGGSNVYILRSFAVRYMITGNANLN